MEKEDKKIFPRVFLFIVLVFFINIGTFFYKYGDIKNKGLTGFSIFAVKETTLNVLNMSILSKIFFIVQWSFLLIVLVYAFFRDQSVSITSQKVDTINVDKNAKRNEKNAKKHKTDLDVLYDILKNRRQLNISTVSKSFNVSNEVATEWAKILESGELATIEYPGFGEPKIVIKDKKAVENEELKENKGKLEEEPKKGIMRRLLERFMPKKDQIVEEIKPNELASSGKKGAVGKVDKKSSVKIPEKMRNNIPKKINKIPKTSKASEKVNPVKKLNLKQKKVIRKTDGKKGRIKKE